MSSTLVAQGGRGVTSVADTLTEVLARHQREMRDNEAYRSAFLSGAEDMIRRNGGGCAPFFQWVLRMYGAL